MKTKNKIYTIFIILFSMVFMYGCNTEDKNELLNPQNNNSNAYYMDYYYLDNVTQKLVGFSTLVNGNTNEERLDYVVGSIKNAPPLESLTSVIPKAVEIKSYSLNNDILSLNLSSSYSNLKSGEEILCRSALVWTFTGFDFVNSVEFSVEGVPLTKTNKEAMGPLSRDDIVINKEIATQPKNTEVLTLYFGNEDATGLVTEQRTVEVNPNKPLELYVVEQIISGPTMYTSIITVPPDTKIRDIKTVDGICYLDLSSEFVTKHNGGTSGELMTIYSIVNSLCTLPHIDTVQFLIEGEKQDEYKGHVDFSKPFEPNFNITF